MGIITQVHFRATMTEPSATWKFIIPTKIIKSISRHHLPTVSLAYKGHQFQPFLNDANPHWKVLIPTALKKGAFCLPSGKWQVGCACKIYSEVFLILQLFRYLLYYINKSLSSQLYLLSKTLGSQKRFSKVILWSSESQKGV